ncbi:MAG: MFS transporter [Clostridiales bacterium]|jgi:sugar phosphate permease|nr:MFS transporter [Clostridiales bacterium]
MFGGLSKFMKALPDAKEKIKDKEKIKKSYSFWRLKMFSGMYFGYLFYYFTRKNISFIKPALAIEWNFSMQDLALLGISIDICYGVGKFLSGMLSDRCNIRAFMALGLFLSSIVNIIFPFLPALSKTLGISLALIASIFWGINGIFQSMGFPPVAKGLVYWFAPKERARKWTLWSTSHVLGAFLIGVIAAFLLGHQINILGLNAWRLTFVIPGLIGIIYSFIILTSLTDKPQTVGLPPIEEYSNDTLPVKKETGMSYGFAIKKYLFTNPMFWSLSLAYIFIYYVRFATLDWGTMFLVDHCSFTQADAASVLKWMPLIGAVGGILSGYLVDKIFKGKCTPVVLISLLISALSCWQFYIHASGVHQAHGIFLTTVFAALIGFSIDGPQNLVGGVQISRIVPQEAVSAATGLAGLFGYLGSILSNLGVAWLTENFGWKSVFSSCILASIIAALLVMLTYKSETNKFQN